jgi:hypothetical protein
MQFNTSLMEPSQLFVQNSQKTKDPSRVSSTVHLLSNPNIYLNVATVKPVLTTTSEYWPPVNNSQSEAIMTSLNPTYH